ncbi:MAG TPA: glutathione peroxidase [Steroidobacteraceae bacterium]|jgi:glutathione peroxidase
MSDFYSFPVKGIDGVADLLAPLRGSVALVVNVASKCGYTSQYAGMETLYRELKGQRFTIIGFPCNQFGAQEPGTDAGIMQFCTTTYNVTFPLASKIDVNGPNRHPVYAWLTAASNGFPGDIQWNFEKFLIGRDGSLLARYPSGTAPEDNGLLQEIAEQL